MTAQLVAYAVLVSLCLAVAGLAMEWLAGAWRQPTRWVWAAMLAASVAIGIGVPMSRRAPAPVSPIVASGFLARRSLGEGGSRTTSPVAPSAPVVASGFNRPRTDPMAALRDAAAVVDPIARTLWPMACAALMLFYAAGHVALARRRRQWPARDVHGVPVLISRDLGPAVIGVLRPQIVLPEWTLDSGRHALGFMLRHEQEHQRARDPLLIQLARAVVLVMPWNPAAWWMVSRLKLAIEFDCDARVLVNADASSPAAYGEVLLVVGARRCPRHAFLGPAMLERSSSLARRIVAMQRTRLRFLPVRVAAAAGVVLAILATIALLPAPALRAAAVSAPAALVPERHDVALALGQAEAQPELQSPPHPLTAPGGPDALEAMRRKIQDTVYMADQAASDAAKKSLFSRPCTRNDPLACVLGATPQTLNPPPDDIAQPGNGVSWPTLIRQFPPQYTKAAMDANIQGRVYLSAVVETNGSLGRIQVTKSLDAVSGLDQAAIDAASKWSFSPCKKDGQPVRCAVQLELEFRLDRPPGAAVTGYLLTANNSPISDASVQLRSTVSGQVEASTRTNALGEFRFPGVKSGPYVVEHVTGANRGPNVIAVGSPFNVTVGETVATFVRSGAQQARPAERATEPVQPGNGVSWPVLIRQVEPQYTQAARDAKIQGTVYLTGVVETDGTAGRIRVTKSLDKIHGLDEAAVDAAKKWTFKPCAKDGKPVPCSIQLELDFRLDRQSRAVIEQDEFAKGPARSAIVSCRC